MTIDQGIIHAVDGDIANKEIDYTIIHTGNNKLCKVNFVYNTHNKIVLFHSLDGLDLSWTATADGMEIVLNSPVGVQNKLMSYVVIEVCDINEQLIG